MNFGLVGGGCIGQLRAKALAGPGEGRLVAVADVDRQRAEETAAAAGARAVDGMDELLEISEIGAVLVCTPPPFHEKAALAALAAGKHVLCEKPLAASPEACRRMVAAAEAADLVLATGFNHRYFDAVKHLKCALDEGVIGNLDHVRAFAGHEGLSQFRSSAEYDSAVIGGGALMDVGIHLIDLTSYVLGGVAEVFGHATGGVWKIPGSEDNGMALLKSPDGVPATLQATWTEWKGYRFHIEAYGDKGMARAAYAPMASLTIIRGKDGSKSRRSNNFYPKAILREKLYGWQSTVVLTFREELADFMASCRDGRTGRGADGAAGLRAVEIAHAVYRSTAEGKPVMIDTP